MTEAEQEARDERTAICLCEKVPQSEIDAMFKSRPDLFGILADEAIQGDMF